MTVMRDMVGQRFGRLTVTKKAPNRSNRVAWYANCDCGAEVWVTGNSLQRGGTRSCGCLHREVTRRGDTKHKKHGLCNTPTWRSWLSMVQRCTNPKYAHYDRYGGSGITVCERWRDLNNFHADMGSRPAGTTLDRIDNSKGYEPGNCRWSTPTVQTRNRSCTVMLDFRGEVKCLAEWCEDLGLKGGAVHHRLSAGWSVERALSTPIRPRGPNRSTLNAGAAHD